MSSRIARVWVLFALTLALMVGAVGTAYAHVKWFSDFTFTDEPLTLAEAVTPTFLILALVTVVSLALAVYIDRLLGTNSLYQRISEWLSEQRHNSLLILRIGAGMVLLLSWQADALLVPKLPIADAWVGWLQFACALLLILPRTVPLAGVGIIILWVMGALQFGIFYMLDYLLFLGVGYYLIVGAMRDDAIRGSGIPALYLTVGFSLFWVGLEKIIYPQWGLYVLETNPQLTLGLSSEFFLVAAAFIELALGYLLIIGLLGRPLGLVITLVFFTTTLVFGKTEVIGHTLIHAALLVFLIEGPGTVYPTPIAIHRRLPWRMAFAAVNFVIILVVLMVPYAFMAQSEFEHAVDENVQQAQIEECQDAAADTIIELDNGDTITCEAVLGVAEDS